MHWTNFKTSIACGLQHDYIKSLESLILLDWYLLWRCFSSIMLSSKIAPLIITIFENASNDHNIIMEHYIIFCISYKEIKWIETNGVCELKVPVSDKKCIYCGKGTVKLFQIVLSRIMKMVQVPQSKTSQNKLLH